MAFSDPTAAHLRRLTPEAAEAASILINACRTAGWPIYISSSKRTTDEQAKLVRAGLSKNPRSKHLTGQAFDIDCLGLSRNQIPDYFWTSVGPFGESLGLRWGGRWKTPYDPGHFELSVTDASA
jgi:hypothetical protein